MLQLIMHLTGDYLLQNDWMAENKGKYSLKGYIACLLHCFLYTSMFVLFLFPLKSCLIIFITHFLIDKYRLAILWCRLKNWNWTGNNFGYGEEKPKWMSTWLVIIIDNTLHLICNFIAIKYFA